VSVTEILAGSLHYYPLYFAWLVGAIVALVRWRRHPRVSQVVLAATALFILAMVQHVATVAWANTQMQAGALSATASQFAFRAAGVAHALLSTASYALLLVAVFGWRANPGAGGGTPPGPPDDAEAED
jgi:hypothetical protein